MIELRTKRLRLVALNVRPEDVSAELGVVVPDGWPAPDLAEILPRYFSELTADPDVLGFGPWVIVAGGEVVGDAGFLGPPDGSRTVELGYSILPHRRLRGFATEAVKALVDWTLWRPDIERVIAACAHDNRASIRVLEKAGFGRIGDRVGELLWELRILARSP